MEILKPSKLIPLNGIKVVIASGLYNLSIEMDNKLLCLVGNIINLINVMMFQKINQFRRLFSTGTNQMEIKIGLEELVFMTKMENN